MEKWTKKNKRRGKKEKKEGKRGEEWENEDEIEIKKNIQKF